MNENRGLLGLSWAFFRCEAALDAFWGGQAVELIFVIVTEDQVLDCLVPASGQLVQVAFVQGHNLTDPVHELLLLVEVKRLEDEAKTDL